MRNNLPVVKRCQFKILVFTYKSLKNEAPSYISDLLNWYQPNRPLRSANTTSITPKRYKSVRYGKRLMDTGAAMRWNSLPNELKCAITTNCLIIIIIIIIIIIFLLHQLQPEADVIQYM